MAVDKECWTVDVVDELAILAETEFSLALHFNLDVEFEEFLRNISYNLAASSWLFADICPIFSATFVYVHDVYGECQSDLANVLVHPYSFNNIGYQFMIVTGLIGVHVQRPLHLWPGVIKGHLKIKSSAFRARVSSQK